MMRNLFIGLCLTVAAGAAQAATLTFDGNICNGGNACANGNPIDQTYGDLANLDVSYDGNGAAIAGAPNVLFWGSGFGTMQNVIYSTGNGFGLSITFTPSVGFEVTVSGFDISPFTGSVVNSSVDVVDLGTNTSLFSQSYTPVPSGLTSEAGTWTSATGIRIDFGPNAFNAAIDNIEYSVSAIGAPPPVVPLPAPVLLLGGAVAGLGLLRRRRST